MNVLFVNSWMSLSKTDCGGSVRTIMMLEALARIANVDVVSFNTNGICAIDNVNVVFNGTIEPEKKHNESRWEKFNRLLRFRDPYSYYPKNEAEERVVDSFVNTCKYDIIVVRYFYQACECGLLKYASRLVIDVDDNPSEALRSQAKLTKSLRNKVFVLLQSFLVQKMVNEQSKAVRFLFYSNPKQAGGTKTAYLHNVSLISSENDNLDFQKTPMRLLLVGNMDYYPNRLGLAHFVRNIFPKILTVIPEVELHVVGKFEDDNIKEKYNSMKGVKCMGFVDNLVKEYADSRVVIVPIYHGAGTSIKVIEAMKMRRPVVSSPYGVRGFESYFKDGRDFLLAKTDDDFIKKTILLLTNREICQSISDSAYESALGNFSQERFCEIIKECLLV